MNIEEIIAAATLLADVHYRIWYACLGKAKVFTKADGKTEPSDVVWVGRSFGFSKNHAAVIYERQCNGGYYVYYRYLDEIAWATR